MVKNEKENKPKKKNNASIINLDTGESYDMPADEFLDKLKESLLNRQPVDETQMSTDELQSVLDGQRGYLCLKERSPTNDHTRGFAVIFADSCLSNEMPLLKKRIDRFINEKNSPIVLVERGKYDIMDDYPSKVDELPLVSYQTIDAILEVWEVD